MTTQGEKGTLDKGNKRKLMQWNDGNNEYDKLMRTKSVKLPYLNTKKLQPWSPKREKKNCLQTLNKK